MDASSPEARIGLLVRRRQQWLDEDVYLRLDEISSLSHAEYQCCTDALENLPDDSLNEALRSILTPHGRITCALETDSEEEREAWRNRRPSPPPHPRGDRALPAEWRLGTPED